MKLSNFKRKLSSINLKADKKYRYKFFKIPATILGEEDIKYISTCQIRYIYLQENKVDLLYEYKGNDSSWKTVSIDDFERYAVPE